jgi:PST family polysaccharide transporter
MGAAGSTTAGDDAAAATGAPPPRGDPAAAAPALGSRAVRGFAWMLGQSLVSRLAGVAGQILLARLLVPRDYGVYAAAFMVYSLVGAIRDCGLASVLVQRQHELSQLANSAFWLSLAFGIGTGAMMAAIAPAAATWYRLPEVVRPILLFALLCPLDALATVPSAWLQGELRFRTLSLVATVNALTTVTVNVALAWAGLGVYSLVLGYAAGVVVRSVALWRAVSFRPQRGLGRERWGQLLGDGRFVLATTLTFTLISQGDYLVLGRLAPPEVFGLYFFAYSLSIQVLSTLTNNLGSVLFPTLSRMQSEPDRQAHAFLRAARTISLLSIPICILQGAVAGPLIRIVFGARWAGAAPMLAILSVGMGVSSAAFGGQLLQAQGRFRAYFRHAIFAASLFFILVIFGTWRAGAIGTAVAVSTYLTILTITGSFVAVAPAGIPLGEVVHAFGRPLLVSVAAAGAGILSARLIPSVRAHDWSVLLVTCAIAAPVYVVLIRWVAPAAWRELTSRMASPLKRWRRASSSSPPLPPPADPGNT